MAKTKASKALHGYLGWVSDRSWMAPTAERFSATVRLPGSKSLTNRELVLSAIASSPSVLEGALISRDSQLMMTALRSLGADIAVSDTTVEVKPASLTGDAKIDCGLAGTVMRFIPPLAALANGRIEFDGDQQARKRPMATTIDSLRKLGVEVESEAASLPFTILAKGRVIGGEIAIDASASSQFVSGLLLSAPRYKKGISVHHIGATVPSLPHIDMTLSCLTNRGVRAEMTSPSSWLVAPGEIKGMRVKIEPDLSNAGPFLAAALVTGSVVRVEQWPEETTQVGDSYRELLTQMGAEVRKEGSDLVVKGTGVIRGIKADMSKAGELVPTIAAIAALASTDSELTGIAHLRGHETDRLKALVTEINKLGGDATELEDGISIRPAKLSGGMWNTYEDHRMATAGAIIGLVVGGIEIEDIGVTSKTMPEFAKLWQQMLGDK